MSFLKYLAWLRPGAQYEASAKAMEDMHFDPEWLAAQEKLRQKAMLMGDHELAEALTIDHDALKDLNKKRASENTDD